MPASGHAADGRDGNGQARMYLSLAFARFLEAAPAALAVGLMLLPRLIGEDAGRFPAPVAALAVFRFLVGFWLLYLIVRQIIPVERAVGVGLVLEVMLGTAVGYAWIATQALALVFAGLAVTRVFRPSGNIEKITLGTGFVLLAVVSVTWHAIDDGLPR